MQITGRAQHQLIVWAFTGFQSTVSNGARGPMVERTAGHRHIPGTTVQSEWATTAAVMATNTWRRRHLFKVFLNVTLFIVFTSIPYSIYCYINVSKGCNVMG